MKDTSVWYSTFILLNVQSIFHFQAATTGLKKLSQAADRENLFMRKHPVEASLHSNFSDHQQDDVANTVLSEYHCSPMVALRSTGDGNCLFNSFSTILTGNESMNIELRYRCCIEMTMNRRKYLRHRLFDRLDVLSPDFDRSCIECAKLGAWASAWEMIALSNVLNITVKSVYPAVSGSKTKQFQTLNSEFKPPFADPEKGKITIMWTHTVLPNKNGFQKTKRVKTTWLPNHFVPLVSESAFPSRQTINRTSVDEKPTSTATQDDSTIDQTERKVKSDTGFREVRSKTSRRRPARKDTIRNADKLISPNRFECLSDEKSSPTPKPEEPEIELPSESPPKTPVNKRPVDVIDVISPTVKSDTEWQNELSTIEEEGSFVSSPVNVMQTNFIQEESEVHNESGASDEDGEDRDSKTDLRNKRPVLTKFMSYKEILEILRGPYVALGEIPRGKKENTYFIIDNENNVTRRENGQNTEYWDDCGAYKKGSRPLSLFYKKDGKLINIVEREVAEESLKYGENENLKQTNYCVEKGSRKTRRYVPLDPQPDATEILKIRYAYNDLVASEPGQIKFKRRVTWIEQVPASILYVPTNVAVVEYIGIFPPRKCHGNAKDSENASDYIRTKDAVKKSLKGALKRAGPKAVEREFNNQTQDEFEKQRNLKQLQNMKHDFVKKNNPSSFARKNAADHIMCVENMAQEHDFVRVVFHVKGISPCVIVYTEQQIKDIKRFCCTDGGAILGMDKTYNLGDFHVTPFTYKNLSVVNRNTQDHPITFGPTFIHSNSSTKTYSMFLHHVADNFTEQELSKLTIGSDDEYAMKASFKRCFPESTHVLCTRHLRKNANDYLENTVGFPIKERRRILDAIFGENGLTSSTDVDMFNKRLERIHSDLLLRELPDAEKTFRQYLDQRLVPLIQNHVIDPVLKGKVPPNWTSNNSESANHILKSATEWKQKSMPDFILKMYEIIVAEQEEVSRAIRGTGNFKLHEKFQHHRLDIDTWVDLDSEKRQKLLSRFWSDKGRVKPGISVSSDGNRRILQTPSAGRKPNQIKRKRAERSRTPSAKKRILGD